MKSNLQNRPGFTLLEITLVLGILMILVTMTIVLSVNAIGRSSLQSTENVLVQSLRRAQILAQNNVQSSRWGVYICPGPTVPAECGSASPSIIIFKRNTFFTFDSVNDQIFEMHPNIAFSGTSLFQGMTAVGKPGIVFQQISGSPTLTGEITFILHEEQRTITMTSKGLVEH